MPERVLPPSSPDVLKAFRRRSPDDSAVGLSAPPGRPLGVTRASSYRESDDLIALRNIVASTQKLNIICCDRGATLGERQNVIKVKLVSGTAGYAVPGITLPNLELD